MTTKKFRTAYCERCENEFVVEDNVVAANCPDCSIATHHVWNKEPDPPIEKEILESMKRIEMSLEQILDHLLNRTTTKP